MKRIISALLCILMLASVFTGTATVAYADESTTIYFANTKGWETVYTYAWYDGGAQNASWPGVKATVSQTVDGIDIYAFDADDYHYVIFNNGKEQTGDIDVDSNYRKVYEPWTFETYSTAEEAVSAYRNRVVYDYYVCGSAGLCGSHWVEADPNCGMKKRADGSYIKVIENVSIGKYEFKINDGSWDESYPAENFYLVVEEDGATVTISLTQDKTVKALIEYVSGDTYSSEATVAPTSSQPSTDASEPGTGTTEATEPSTPDTNTYYPACDSNISTLVDALKSINVDSSKANRSLIAAANGIDGYTGTASQNLLMLSLLKQGKLIMPTEETTTAPAATESLYYRACPSTCTTLSDALEAIGVDSSKENRTYIAVENGITDYTGTAEQNEYLLNLLKEGKLLKRTPQTTTAPSAEYYPACESTYTTLYDALKSINVDASMSNRMKIATANGISDYSGTADQNNALLKLLKEGKLIKPTEKTTAATTAPTDPTGSTSDTTATTVAPAKVGYCLVGDINGKSVGQGDDWQSVVNEFVDGKFTYTFTKVSYVYVKTTDCNTWYMTAGWLGYVSSAKLYNADDGSMPSGKNADKLYVPEGTYEFTLVENEDGTLSLSYDEPKATESTKATETTKATEATEGSTGETTETVAKYYPACDASHTGLVAALNSIGVDSSKEYRTLIAAANGIEDYAFTPEQNTALLNLLKEGKLINPEYAGDATEAPKPAVGYCLVGYIDGANVGIEEDFSRVVNEFVDGKIIFTVEDEAYVYAKSDDCRTSFMTAGWLGKDVTSAVLYNTKNNSLPTGEVPNKLYVPAGTYEFTLIENGDGTLTLSYAEPKASESTESTEDSKTELVTFEPTPIEYLGDEFSFVIAGSKELCGTNWDATDKNNELVYNEETGLYEVIYNKVAAGTYEFKITTNGEWGEGEYNLIGDAANGGANASITVAEDDSTVKVVFDSIRAYVWINGEQVAVEVEIPQETEDTNSTEPSTEDVSDGWVTYEPTPIEYLGDNYTFVIAGAEGLCGSNWDPKDESNKLVYNEETGLYEATYEKVAAGTYEFKITTNGAWGAGEYNLVGDAANGGANASITVTEDDSTVKFAFDATRAYVWINGKQVAVKVETPEATEHTHQWDKGTVTKEASCTTEGERVHKCSGCDETKTEVIEKAEHTFDEGTVIKAPTCKEEGVKLFICAKCQYANAESIELSGHKSAEDWVTTKDATCTANGEMANKCVHCDKVLATQAINATGHKTTTTGAKKATYFAKGHTGNEVCTVCNATVKAGKAIAKLKLKTPKATVKGDAKKITVKYKKVAGATGFQVKYKFNGKNVIKTFNAKKNVTKVIKNLKAGSYKVQVRAMVKKNGKKAFSKWTKAKTVKVK